MSLNIESRSYPEASCGYELNFVVHVCFILILCLHFQYNICKKKLNSKREALKILTSDLELCQRERDIYKTKIKQLVGLFLFPSSSSFSKVFIRHWRLENSPTAIQNSLA